MGFVEDKTIEINKEEIFERGEQVLWWERDEAVGTLSVSPAAAPQEVEQDETAEEEDRDDEEEPYDAKKQVDSVQSSPFNRCGPPYGLTANSRDGRI